jgi:hypothetical protein
MVEVHPGMAEIRPGSTLTPHCGLVIKISRTPACMDCSRREQLTSMGTEQIARPIA